MIEYGVINILVKLVEHQNTSIKINTMWALMNMAFQAEQKVKQQILSSKNKFFFKIQYTQALINFSNYNG